MPWLKLNLLEKGEPWSTSNEIFARLFLLSVVSVYFTHILQDYFTGYRNGPLTWYVKLRVAHAPGMLGTFSPPPRVGYPDMHHGACLTRVPWCMPGSLTSGFLWSRWRRKHSRHPRCMRNPQFYVSGKRPMILRFPKCPWWIWVNTSWGSTINLWWYKYHNKIRYMNRLHVLWNIFEINLDTHVFCKR